MAGPTTRVWLLLAILGLCDACWCLVRDIAVADCLPFVIVSAGLLAIALIGCRDRRARRIAAIAEGLVLWLIFSAAGALLTYLAAARGGPLYDRAAAAADAALGFDWNAWFRFIAGHPALHWPLAAAYKTLLPQILFSVLWFSRADRDWRSAELLTNAIVALLLTTAIFSMFPTFGPGVGVPALSAAYVQDLANLRAGALPAIDLMLLKGVIAFPSYHAVLAVLFTYAHRRSPTFLPIAALNLVMLASLPSEGGHYLIDVVGGLAVATTAILSTRILPSRQPALLPTGAGAAVNH